MTEIVCLRPLCKQTRIIRQHLRRIFSSKQEMNIPTTENMTNYINMTLPHHL